MSSSHAALPGLTLPAKLQLSAAVVLSEGQKVHVYVTSLLSMWAAGGGAGHTGLTLSSVPSELVYGGFQLLS